MKQEVLMDKAISYLTFSLILVVIFLLINKEPSVVEYKTKEVNNYIDSIKIERQALIKNYYNESYTYQTVDSTYSDSILRERIISSTESYNAIK